MRRRRDGCEAGGYVVLSLVFPEAGCTAYEFASSFPRLQPELEGTITQG